MIDQLRGELEEIQYALWKLEAVAAGRPRRGRPPKWARKFTGKRNLVKPKARTRRRSDERHE